MSLDAETKTLVGVGTHTHTLLINIGFGKSVEPNSNECVEITYLCKEVHHIWPPHFIFSAKLALHRAPPRQTDRGVTFTCLTIRA